MNGKKSASPSKQSHIGQKSGERSISLNKKKAAGTEENGEEKV
jgi:hypothetical protein